MMKLNKITLASLLTMSLIGMAVATQAKDQKPESTSEATAAAAKPKRDSLPFHGKIAAVDKIAMTITLEGKEAQRVLQITSETRFTKDGKPATLDDAVVGEQIAGSYKKTDDGKMEALSVRLGPKPEAEKPIMKEKKEKKEKKGEESEKSKQAV
jgi:hypothetical protein